MAAIPIDSMPCSVRLALCDEAKKLSNLSSGDLNAGSCSKTSKDAKAKLLFLRNLYNSTSSTIPPLEVLIKIMDSLICLKAFLLIIFLVPEFKGM